MNRSPAGGTRVRQKAQPVLAVLVTVGLFLLGSGVIGWLATRSAALQDLSRLAQHVQVDAYTLSGQGEATGLGVAFERYDLTLEQEFAALEVHQVAVARSIQQEAASDFDDLARATEVVSGRFDAAADRALVQAVVGSITIFLLAGIVVVLTYRRAQRGRASEVQRFEHEATHDPLTDLPNRRLLTRRLEEALRSTEEVGSVTALLLMDLDRFKDVNETLGHACGDEMLIMVGDRLRTASGASDTVARLGGDEFAILLPQVVDIDAALAVANRLREALSEGFAIEGVDIDIDAGIGVVVSDRDGDDALTLFRHVDVAMHAAKTRGLGVATYERRGDESSLARLTMLRQLRQAISSDELILHYQPKVSIDGHEVVGVEALVRWNHPERGLVPPDQFIPSAERSGLIGPLTRHILDMALDQCQRWIDAGHPLRVAVNVSARNLGDDRFFEHVFRSLEARGIPPSMLTLEITESAMVTDPERARALLARLFALGVKLSIDDFGTGYTSLAQLKSMPIEELKIDRSFVSAMTSDVGSVLIVEGIVALAHKLGFTTVGEGIEDEATLTALSDMGCDVAQGYLFARPMPAEELDRWLRAFGSIRVLRPAS
jgi:diguanylate cyclase (GGDEF)-like protein